MEQVCQEDVPQSVKRQSLATLKEHSDNHSNHDNEKFTSSCQPSSDTHAQYTSTGGGNFSLRAHSRTTRSSSVSDPKTDYTSGVTSEEESPRHKDDSIVSISTDSSPDTDHSVKKLNKNILDVKRAQLQRKQPMGFIPAVKKVSQVSLEDDSGLFSASDISYKPYHVTEIKVGSTSGSTRSSIDTGTGDEILLREGRQRPRLFRLPSNGSSNAGSPDLSSSTRSNCIERLRSV